MAPVKNQGFDGNQGILLFNKRRRVFKENEILHKDNTVIKENL